MKILQSNNDIKIYSNICMLICSFIFTIILLIISGHLLNYFFHFPTINRKELVSQLSPIWLNIATWSYEFGPHKTQHFIFISLSLLCPIYCLLAMFLTSKLWLMIKRYVASHKQIYLMHCSIIAISIIFFALICYIAFATPFTITGLHLTNPTTMTHYRFLHEIFNHVSLFALLAILLISFLTLTYLIIIKHYFKKTQHKKKIIHKLIKITLITAAILAIIISSFSGHLLTFNFLTYHPYSVAIADLDTVFYSSTQIMQGKTLLSNVLSMYGTFPEILYPLFKVIGLSTLKFSLVMCVLQCIALFSLFLAIYLLTNNTFISTLYAVFSSLICGGIFYLVTSHGISELSPYYEYWPVRFIFPALSILMFRWLVKKITFKKTIIMGCFISLAVIWNLDSGIPVFGATLFYVFFLLLFTHSEPGYSRKYIIKNIILVICTVIIFFVLFALYMEIKSGFSINWKNIFKYQHIFYNLGVGQMPMPKELDMWCVILAIYLFGIIYSFSKWFNNENTNNVLTSCILYLSILGIGLFTYYEYRAHPLNLIGVSWPAILLWCIFANEIFTKIKQQKLPVIIALFSFPVIFLCLFSTIIYAYLLPTLYQRSIALTATSSSPNSELTKEFLFIKNELHGDKKATILLLGQSILSAELATVSELDGPSEMEILLKSDYDNTVKQLLTNHISHIFLKQNDIRLPLLLNKYQIVKKSSTGIVHLKSLSQQLSHTISTK